MKEDDIDRSHIVEVFKGSPWEAELVKGLLEDSGIATMLKDGILGTLAPYLAPEVAVLVKEDDYEAAMEVTRERDKENPNN